MNEVPSVFMILWLTLRGRRDDVLEMADWVSQSNGTLSTPVQWAINYGYQFWLLIFASILFVLYRLLSKRGEAASEG